MCPTEIVTPGLPHHSCLLPPGFIVLAHLLDDLLQSLDLGDSLKVESL